MLYISLVFPYVSFAFVPEVYPFSCHVMVGIVYLAVDCDDIFKDICVSMTLTILRDAGTYFENYLLGFF